MSPLPDLQSWLIDYQLIATLFLAASLLAMRCLGQPADRLAIARLVAPGLVVLAALCALPQWPSWSPMWSDGPKPPWTMEREVGAAVPQMNRGGRTNADVNAASDEVALVSAAPSRGSQPRQGSQVRGPSSSSPPERLERSRQFSVGAIAIAAYPLGAAAIALWLLAGAIQTARLCLKADAAPRELVAICARLRDTDQPSFQLLVSKHVATPLALGVIWPRILLPADGTIDKSNLESVLSHEMAHIRNGDLQLLALLRCLLVALFANPLYWLLRRRIRSDQEIMADAAAASRTSNQEYAEQLLNWARHARYRRRHHLLIALGIWDRRSHLSHRIRILLTGDTKLTCSKAWRCSALFFVAATVLGLSTLTLEPSGAIRANTAGSAKEAEPPNKTDAAIGDSRVVRLGSPPAFGESGQVSDFAFSKAESRMAIGTLTGRVSVWDLRTVKRLYEFDNRGKSVDVVAISPNGNRVAAGNDQDGSVRIWKVGQDEDAIQFRGLPGADPKGWWRGSLEFSPDSTILASGSNDKVIRLWDVSTGKLLREMAGHDHTVGHLAFTDEGDSLISASLDGSVRLWDVESGEEIKRWHDETNEGGRINSMAYVASSAILATGTYSGLYLRDVKRDLELPLGDEISWSVAHVAASRNGELLATIPTVGRTHESAPQTVTLWKGKPLKQAGELKGLPRQINKLEFLDDGRTLATLSRGENRVRFWDVESGQEDYVATIGHTGGVYSVEFSPDGRVLASWGGDQTLRFWDVSNEKQLLVSEPQMQSIESLAHLSFSPDGKTVAGSGTWSDRVRVFDVRSGEPTREFSLRGIRGFSPFARLTAAFGFNSDSSIAFGTLGYSNDGDSLVGVGYHVDRDICVRKWHTKTGEEVVGHNLSMKAYLEKSEDAARDPTWPSTAALSPDCKILAIGSGTAIHFVNVDTGRRVGRLPKQEAYVVGTRFSPDGKTIAVTTYSVKGGVEQGGAIHLWDWRAGKKLRTIDKVGTGTWHHVRFSPAGDLCAALRLSQDDSSVTVSETMTGKQVFVRRGGPLMFRSLAWTPDAKRLAVGLADGGIELWDVPQGETD